MNYVLFSKDNKIKDKSAKLFKLLDLDLDEHASLELSPRDHGNVGNISFDYLIYIDNLKKASDSDRIIVCLDNNTYSHFKSAIDFVNSKSEVAFTLQKFLQSENISIDKIKSSFLHINDIILKNIKLIESRIEEESYSFKYTVHCGLNLPLNENQKIAYEAKTIINKIYPNFKYIDSTSSFNSTNDEKIDLVAKNLVDSGAEFIIGYDLNIFNAISKNINLLPKDYISDNVSIEYMSMPEVILKRLYN